MFKKYRHLKEETEFYYRNYQEQKAMRRAMSIEHRKKTSKLRGRIHNILMFIKDIDNDIAETVGDYFEMCMDCGYNLDMDGSVYGHQERNSPDDNCPWCSYMISIDKQLKENRIVKEEFNRNKEE